MFIPKEVEPVEYKIQWKTVIISESTNKSTSNVVSTPENLHWNSNKKFIIYV